MNAAGIVTGSNTVAIRTGRNFTAEDLRGSGKYGTPLVNVGGAEFRVAPGHFGPALVTFDAETDRRPGGVRTTRWGERVSPDQFRIRPSPTSPIEVNGNAPGQPLLPGQLTGLTAAALRRG